TDSGSAPRDPPEGPNGPRTQTRLLAPETLMKAGLRICWWDDSAVGHLIQKGPLFFVYDEAWLRRGLDLSPISLPFTDVAFNGQTKGIEGLPGLIADCLPDAWGR